MARREKKPVHKVVMTEGKRQIIQQLLQEYDIETAEDIQDALKDLLGSTIKEMMEAEMDDHLGYEKSERSDSDDYRNGYKEKTVNSSYGSMRIDVPQDRKSTFEPKVVKKRQKDISDIDQKIISMYAKGMTTLDMKNPNDLIPTTTVTDTKKRPSTPAMAPCGSMFHRIVSPRSNPRLSKSARRTFRTSTRRSSPCTPRG